MTGIAKQSIGIAGCGAMGLPMALALQATKFNVCGYDVRPSSEFVNFETSMITDPHQFSNKCDIVFCVVRDEKQVLDLCFNDQAIFNSATPPKIFVLSSTVSPRFVHTLREKLPENVTLIDAPMTGAPLGAINATLTFMVGGAVQAVDHLKPLFSAMGNKTLHLGDLGTGMTAKVLNNFVAATTVIAVRNVLHHASKLGMSQQSLLEVLNNSSGQTWFGSNFEQIDWADETYTKANTIGILEKDVNSFIDALEDGPEPLHKAIITALQTLPRLPA